MSEEEIINAIKPIVNARKTHKDNELYSLQLNAYQLDVIEALLDLYNKEKEKNKNLEEDLFDSEEYIRELQHKLTNAIEIKYINKDYISKDKIREKIKELEKEADYRTINNPTGRIHFHKEPCDYQIEVLQELLEE